jgi:hypothetical protein
MRGPQSLPSTGLELPMRMMSRSTASYASAQMYPVESWGYGNLAVGLIGIASGMAILLAGAILLFANRRRRPSGPRQST